MYKKTIISLVVVCFLLTMIVLGVSIAFGITNRQANAENERISNDLENVYKRNYYELSYELSNAGDSLNKLLVTAFLYSFLFSKLLYTLCLGSNFQPASQCVYIPL